MRDIPTPYAWFDASSITGVTNGSTLSTWNDSGPNGFVMTAGTAPIYRTGQLNGHPAVDFSSGKVMTSNASAVLPNVTVFVVIKQSSLGTYYPFQPSSNGGVLLRTLSNGRIQFGIQGEAFPSASSTAANVNTSTYTVQGATWNGSNVTHFSNGTNTNSVNPTPFTANVSGSSVIRVNSYEGLLAEMIVYDRALSDWDRAIVNSYFQDKYGIAVSDYVSPFGHIKVWDGTSWVVKMVKVWDGAGWNEYPLNYYDGSGWFTTNY